MINKALLTLTLLVASGCTNTVTSPDEPPLRDGRHSKKADTDSKPSTTGDHQAASNEATKKIAPITRQPIDVDLQKQFGDSVNQFAVKLWKQLPQSGNQVVSPLSVHMALAMTALGAKSETEKEMNAVLGLTADRSNFNAVTQQAIARWKSAEKDGLTMAIANSVFVDSTVTLQLPFLAASKEIYGNAAIASPLTTKPQQARDQINGWINRETRGQITSIFSPPDFDDRQTLAVLVNAIYVKALWRFPFNKSETQLRAFEIKPNECIQTPFMYRSKNFRLAKLSLDGTQGATPSNGIQILTLPYQDDEISMVLVLPENRGGLAAVERKLTPQLLQTWLSAGREQHVVVKLPRFKLEPQQTVKLKGALSQLGMPMAFTNAANFSALTNQSLKIGDVGHKAMIEVDEEGTVATAVTAVELFARTGAKGPGPTPFIADHPFLMFLKDNKTGSVLFMSRVELPETGKAQASIPCPESYVQRR